MKRHCTHPNRTERRKAALLRREEDVERYRRHSTKADAQIKKEWDKDMRPPTHCSKIRAYWAKKLRIACQDVVNITAKL